MNINLPHEIDDFINDLVTAGRFESKEAAIAEGMRLLKSHEKLRQDIASGLKQLDEGQWIDGETVFRELDDEIDRIAASQ